jgi:photosystem II stability/assembly factor-like uncharacterized protein
MNVTRKIIILAWTLAAAAPPACAARDYLVRMYYDGVPARLADTSFVPYAVYGDYAVGEVSAGYSAHLAAQGFRFDVIAEDPEQKKIWEVRLPVAALPAAAEVALTLGPSRYIVTTPQNVDIVAGDRSRRLRPIAVDFESLARKPQPVEFEARDEVADIVAAVDRSRYEKTVRDLVAFGTRYSYAPQCKRVADYLADAFSKLDVDVHRDRYFGPELKEVATAGPDVAWAAGELGVVARTTNAGKHWDVVGQVGDDVISLACSSANEAWMGGKYGEYGVIWHTENGGLTWDENLLGQGDVNDLYFLDRDRGWAVTTSGDVFRTTDGGDTWQLMSNVGAWLRGVAFSDDKNGLICGSAGYIARTVNGGSSWQKVGAAPPYKLETVAYRTRSDAYAVGEGGTVLRSTDGGSSWAGVGLNTGRYLRDAAFAGNAGYIVGGVGGFWRTRDGSSWRNKAAPKQVLYSVAALPPERVWCGAGSGAIPYSPDGGDTWQDQAGNADPTSEFVWDNVWAEQRGRGGAPGTVLVCAHYDSVSELSSLENPEAPAPGADDNATGAAAVLEFARAGRGHAYRRDVIYVCFSGEEEGLLGSSHFASRMATAGEPLLGVINMDMLGFADKLPEDADVITDVNSVWLAAYMRAAASSYVPSLGVDITVDEKMWLSDHKSFWDFGYAANLVIEDWPLVYKYANTSKDTIDHVNFDVGTLMTRGVVATAASLASPTSVPVVSSLDAVKVYPNPYKSGKHHGRVYFANLPANSKIKFYNIAGELVWEGGNGAEPLWALELSSKAGTIESSGIFLYLIETPSGEKKTGKLAVIR